MVRHQARTRARRFENARRRTEPVSRHAFPADIERRQNRTVEGVVIPREDVPGHTHIRRDGLVLPAISTQDELTFRTERRGA